MNVRMEPRHRQELLEHARHSSPDECCGLLLGTGSEGGFIIQEVHPTANVWSGDRSHRYEIDPRAYMALQRDVRDRGIEIIGYYHSHPDAPAVPSGFDTERAWERMVYVIVTLVETESRTIRAWIHDEDDESWSEAKIESPE